MTYLETENTKILVDDGLSCQETVKRLSLLGISPTQIDAIMVTHEHNDHIKGIDVFSKKYDTPVFAHEKVWANLDNILKNVQDKMDFLLNMTTKKYLSSQILDISMTKFWPA